MPNISLTDYSSAAAPDYSSAAVQAARQQQMAQALQAQSQEPIQVSTYDGFQAPISPLSGLAKMLQAYEGAKMERDAQKKIEDASVSDNAALMKLLGGGTEDVAATPGPAASPPMAAPPAGPSNPAYTGPMPNNADLVSALKGGLGGPVGQPIVPPETPPMAGPSQMAMASALGGKPVAAPTAPAQPIGGMVPNPAATPPVAPVAAPVAPQQSDVMTRLAADKALAAKLTAGLVSPALSPTSKAVVASQLKTVTDRISDTQKMFDKSQIDSVTKESDRVAGVGRAVNAVDGLNVPDNVKDTMRNLAQNFGENGIKPYMDILAKNQLGPHEKYMTPDEMAQHGVPPGSVAQYDDQSGKTTILINGHTEAVADQNVALRRQEVGNEARNTAQNNVSAPVPIEYTGATGEPVQAMASWDKAHGYYVDASTNQPILHPQGLQLLPTGAGAGRSAARLQGNLVALGSGVKDLGNLASISSSGGMGITPNLKTTPLNMLFRKVTPQEIQDMQATISGLKVSLATVATAGGSPSVPAMESMSGLELNSGDTGITKMRKLAIIRQNLETGIDAAIASSYTSTDQKALLKAQKSQVAAAVPWTVSQVQQLENSKNPHASLQDYGVKATGGTSYPSNLPPGTQFSKLRQQYRDPSGKMYDINGKPL